jgi:ATP-dependent helicase/nuclease subunit B
VDAPPGGAERGSFIHDAIGDFAATWAVALPPDPYGELIRLGRQHFAHVKDFPEAHAFWWPRFERIARWFADFETRRRAGMAAAHAEIRGQLTFPADPAQGAGEQRTFRLTGRADRIEQLANGSYAVLDFKTGTLPSNKQVQIGVSPQLTLEAAMLREGAFPGLEAGASVTELVYVRLHGGNPAGKELTVSLGKGRSPDDAADAALAELKALVTRFEDEATPYRPLVLSMWSNRYGAYDDLARVKEWSLSEGEEGEE